MGKRENPENSGRGVPVGYDAIGLFLVVLALGTWTTLAGPSPVRVKSGGEAYGPACQAIGEIALQTKVRSGPGETYSVRENIEAGTAVRLCEERGDWIGVVYDKERAFCEITSSSGERTVYTGPCSSGWVPRAAVRI